MDAREKAEIATLAANAANGFINAIPSASAGRGRRFAISRAYDETPRREVVVEIKEFIGPRPGRK